MENRVRVKSSEMARGLANARPPGSVKFANAPPPGLTRRANAPQLPGGELGAGGIDWCITVLKVASLLRWELTLIPNIYIQIIQTVYGDHFINSNNHFPWIVLILLGESSCWSLLWLVKRVTSKTSHWYGTFCLFIKGATSSGYCCFSQFCAEVVA